MTKFFVMSDIHIDNARSHGFDYETLVQMYMRRIEKIQDRSERVWLLAGDVTSFGPYSKECYDVLKQLCSEFKHVFMVFGNHDYASSFKVEDVIEKCKEYAKEIPNLTILDGDVVEYDGLKIGGCLGWYTWFDQKSFDYAEQVSWKNWYDGYCWNYLDNNVQEISKVEVAKMKKVLAQKPDIMITHIAHECMNTNPMFKTSGTNKFFFYLDKDFDFDGVKYLINGHVHHSDTQDISTTKVLCNPFGYIGENPLEVHGKTMEDFLFEL